MQCRVLLTLALVACILFITLDAKAIKHKHHGKKKAHVSKHKKINSRQDTPDGGAPEPAGAGAGAGAGTDSGAAAGGAAAGGAAGGAAGAGAPDAGAAGAGTDAGAAGGAPDAGDGAEPTDGEAPDATPPPGGSTKAGGVPPIAGNPNDMNGNGVDDRLEQQRVNPNDLNGNSIDDRLEQGQAPAQAPAPAPEEDDGSASGEIPEMSAPPNLYGGHMLPGPTPEPNYFPTEVRYCNEPCPQQCAPACYEWCCFPSIQPPQPPVQLMLVPVKAKAPPPPSVPQPLPYPMNGYGPAGACSPMPCAAKKHLVTGQKSKSRLFSTFTNASSNLAAVPINALSRDTLERKSENKPADMPTLSSLTATSKSDSTVNNNNTKDISKETFTKPVAKITNTGYQAQSAAIVEDD